MNNFSIERLEIEGLIVIRSRVFGDARGHFVEGWNEASFAELGLDMRFVQDNRSRSSYGTVRGLHFQKTRPQGKLVYVTSGEVFDVAVDMRASSPTFGRWHAETLTDDGKMFYVPPGFAHGFLVLSESADFGYKCTDFYMPSDEGGLAWDDPTVGIEWPKIEPGRLVISEKDRHAPPFAEAYRFEMGGDGD